MAELTNIRTVLHELVHRHAVDETTKAKLHRLIDSDEADESTDDQWVGKNDDEVLNAAFAGDESAKVEYAKRRAQAQGSTVTPVGIATQAASEA